MSFSSEVSEYSRVRNGIKCFKYIFNTFRTAWNQTLPAKWGFLKCFLTAWASSANIPLLEISSFSTYRFHPASTSKYYYCVQCHYPKFIKFRNSGKGGWKLRYKIMYWHRQDCISLKMQEMENFHSFTICLCTCSILEEKQHSNLRGNLSNQKYLKKITVSASEL